MKKSNLTPKNEKIRREQDPIPWRYCLLTLVCGLLLVVGFFWAARQHFSAMDFGIKNAKLRQQKESLESELRLLDRNKEISLAPSEIKKVAKKLGLQDLTAESIEVLSSVKNTLTTRDAASKQALVKKTAKVEKTDSQKQTEATKIDEKVKENKPQATAPTDLRERTLKK